MERLFTLLITIILICACNSAMNVGPRSNNSNEQCADSIIAYKQITIPGTQLTDLEGNKMHTQIVQYSIYIFSDTDSLVIDSVKNGTTRFSDVNVSVVKKTPLYKEDSEKTLLVGSTPCFVQQIVINHSNNSQDTPEKDNLHVFYKKNNVSKSITLHKTILLEQAVTQ